MPYKLEDLRAPGMDQNFKTVEGEVAQPAIKVAKTSSLPTQPVQPVSKKHSLKLFSPLKKSKATKQTSEAVSKAKDILLILFLFLIGVSAVAVVIKGIQLLFGL